MVVCFVVTLHFSRRQHRTDDIIVGEQWREAQFSFQVSSLFRFRWRKVIWIFEKLFTTALLCFFFLLPGLEDYVIKTHFDWRRPMIKTIDIWARWCCLRELSALDRSEGESFCGGINFIHLFFAYNIIASKHTKCNFCFFGGHFSFWLSDGKQILFSFKVSLWAIIFARILTSNWNAPTTATDWPFTRLPTVEPWQIVDSVAIKLMCWTVKRIKQL